MPFYEKNNQIIHFIHIPKAGGTSVRRLLEGNGWSSVKLPRFFDDGSGRQIDGHMPRSYWQDLEISKNVSYEFAIVRDPVRRCMSHINMTLSHQFDLAKKIIEKIPEGRLPDEYYSNDEKDTIRQIISMLDFWPRADVEQVHFSDLIQNLWFYTNKTLETISFDDFDFRNRVFYVKNYIEKTCEIKYENLTWEHLLTWFFNYYDNLYDTYETNGVSPDPQHLYVSDSTRIFKLENKYVDLENELKNLGIISEKSKVGEFNRKPKVFQVSNSFNLDQNFNLKKRWFELYDKDYELFDYEKCTKFGR